MKWISVKEHLPENNSHIIVATSHWVGEAFFECFNQEPKFYTNEMCCSRGLYDVSYWMPLPELPKE
jgi:hypothetical protein